MNDEGVNWTRWQRFFTARRDRQLPTLFDPTDYTGVPDSVAQSLAIFQLGESGGGTIIEQARNSTMDGIDDKYVAALELFVNEEHRHAELLAICVRNLGGSLISKNWTASLFVFARRLIGLRLKVLVLLVAEVVGLCYYQLLASRLPPGRLRSLLAQIVTDEHSHLRFHCCFLQTQTRTWWRRLLFVGVWRITMTAAAIVVYLDHRATMRDLGLSPRIVWRHWLSFSRLAENLVVTRRTPAAADLVIREASCQPASAEQTKNTVLAYAEELPS
ncbi:MAG: hypothetical protein ACR2Q3_06000 [Woeseiaceae bacterium]